MASVKLFCDYCESDQDAVIADDDDMGVGVLCESCGSRHNDLVAEDGEAMGLRDISFGWS